MQKLSIVAAVVLVLSGCGARLAEVQTCRIVSCKPSVDEPVNDWSEKHELTLGVENHQGVDFLIVKGIRRDWIESQPFSGGGIDLRDIREGNTLLKVRIPPTVTRCMTDSGRLSFCLVFNTPEEFREHVIEASRLREEHAPSAEDDEEASFMVVKEAIRLEEEEPVTREPYSYSGWISVIVYHPYDSALHKNYLAKGSITKVDSDMEVKIAEGVPDSIKKNYAFHGWGYRKDINVPVLHVTQSGDGRSPWLELLSSDTM